MQAPTPITLRTAADAWLTGARDGVIRTRGGGAYKPATIRWTPTALRAKRAWKRAGLDPIGLHECRHTFASLMIAAGVNAKALSTYMGHATIGITLDRYGQSEQIPHG